MNNAQKIEQLANRFGHSVQVFERKKALGLIKLAFSRGWLWMKEYEDYWSLTLASGRASHQPLDGPAVGIDLRKDNGELKVRSSSITGVWKSALAMWPVRDKGEAAEIVELISSAIDSAYRYHFGEQY